MNHAHHDSYRRTIGTFQVLLALHVVLFKLILLWIQIALLIKPG